MNVTNAEQGGSYYQRNRARLLAKQKAYYEEHRDERLAYAAKYQREHPEVHRKATERHRKKDPEATRAYYRDYYRKNLERLRESGAEEQRRNGPNRQQRVDPDKRRARSALDTAVRSGKLAKPSNCERCGREESGRRLHGHHSDYNKPLSVAWLCSLCHGEEHQVKD